MSIYQLKTHVTSQNNTIKLNQSEYIRTFKCLEYSFVFVNFNFSRVGYSIKRKISQLDFYKDRDSQIRAIEKSFEAAKKPVSMI